MRADRLATAGIVRVNTVDGALRPRVVGLAESLAGPAWFAALIEGGSARIADEAGTVVAPALIWRRWSRESRVSFEAGSIATYVLLGATPLAASVGRGPNARDMREVADRDVVVPLETQSDAFAAMRSCFSGLRREVLSNSPAARAVVEAYLRVILVEIYRACLGQLFGNERTSTSERLFARFSALVERHFRDRWSVNRYALELGTSRDRLGDVCRRVRGIGPKELIDRRVAVEARLHLEHSAESIQQVAGLLGFASAAQFNKFFRRTVGQPPGAYRAAAEQGQLDVNEDPMHLYSWP